jgi:hypothetical protein
MEKMLSEERTAFLERDFYHGFIKTCGFKLDVLERGRAKSSLEVTESHRGPKWWRDLGERLGLGPREESVLFERFAGKLMPRIRRIVKEKTNEGEEEHVLEYRPY